MRSFGDGGRRMRPAGLRRVAGVILAAGWLVSSLLGRQALLPVVAVVANHASQASAQDEAAVEDMGDPAVEDGSQDAAGGNLLMFFLEAMGWIYSTVFLVLSFTLVSLLVMGILQLRRSVLMPDALSADFEQHVAAREFQPAFDLAKEDDSYLGHVVAAGMGALSSAGGQAKMIEAMQDASRDEAMKIEHKISYIALVGALAPMFGLLGTVHGMVDSFQKIALSAAAPKPKELAGGISTALITTLVGLVVAIPAIAAFAVFKNWLQRLSSDTDAEAERLVGSVVSATQTRGSARPAAAPPAAPAG